MSDDPPQWAMDKARAMLAASPALSKALGLLIDDGMDEEKAAQLVLGAERGGQDPVAAAEHIIRLRKAIRR